jgi:RNA polymerase sigma factor (TIGR02999 family)
MAGAAQRAVVILPVAGSRRKIERFHGACQPSDRLTIAHGHVNRYARPSMSEVTRILSAIEQGDPHAAEQLLPLVYDELRKLAAQKLAQEKPGQTLDATALVHEAYMRLVGPADADRWRDRAHFFATAARAMRRILVDKARAKQAIKRGGGQAVLPLEADLVVPEATHDLLALDEALERLEAEDPQAAQLVHLRFFAGLTSHHAAQALGISDRTAERLWHYARLFLFKELKDPGA